jgi:hypothetical protein
MDAGNEETAEAPKIVATQMSFHSIDIASNIVLHYPKSGRQGILTSTTEIKSDPMFCRIESTEDHITVEGLTASVPSSFTVYQKNAGSTTGDVEGEVKLAIGKTQVFEKTVTGFYWEADTVALDIAAGRKESVIMPHAEKLRVMEMLDKVRRQGGARFPQDTAVMATPLELGSILRMSEYFLWCLCILQKFDFILRQFDFQHSDRISNPLHFIQPINNRTTPLCERPGNRLICQRDLLILRRLVNLHKLLCAAPGIGIELMEALLIILPT